MKKFILTLFIILVMPLTSFAKPVNLINVAFTIDNNYPIYTLLAINSILYNNYSSSNYHFYIVENNITDKNKKLMRSYVENVNKSKLFDTKIDFIHIDTDTIDKRENLFAFSNRITPIAIARIMLPDLLPKDVEKVIYLDGDILVTADLKDLYTIKLGRYPFGMAMNISQMGEALKDNNIDLYYNSGVILMDLKRCRQTKTSERMLTYLNKNMDKFLYDNTDIKNNAGKFLYPDQDLINVVLDKEIKTIPQRWNNQTISGVYMVELGSNSGSIIHYIGPNKPWNFNKPYNKVELLYMKYWDSSKYLKPYKYFYVYEKMKKEYFKLAKLKMKRYVSLFKNIRERNEMPSVFSMFYVKPNIVN